MNKISKPVNLDESVESKKKILFNYKNHKGRVSTRTVTPIEMYFGSTDFHRADQWLLTAYCHDKKAVRAFAMKDIYGIQEV